MNFNNKSCIFIAEIGQNHQGDINTAKQLILQAKKIGIDCVKFQKSNLNEKFTASALDRPYTSVNSFGATYGEHKEYLEFTIDQFKELQEFSNSIGILFAASAMDMISLDELIELKPPFIKIGSGDANNIPLLQKASQCECPIIVSSGMQKFSTVHKIAKIMENHNNCALLHCVSSYPVEPEDANLRRIEEYRRLFPHLTIGYSGHESGILLSQVAYLLGAKIIERHFTFDKSAKGSDHCLSLLPGEYKNLILNIYKIAQEYNEPPISDTFKIIQILREFNTISKQNELEIILALKVVTPRDLMKCEMPCYAKLGKTLVYRDDLKKEHVLRRRDIAVKVSEPQGLPAELIDDIIGYSLVQDVVADQPIYKMHLTL